MRTLFCLLYEKWKEFITFYWYQDNLAWLVVDYNMWMCRFGAEFPVKVRFFDHKISLSREQDGGFKRLKKGYANLFMSSCVIVTQ